VAEGAPTPPAETYQPGDLVIRRDHRFTPVRVVAVIPWPGTPCGYLVEHTGTGIPVLSGDNIRPCPPGRLGAPVHPPLHR